MARLFLHRHLWLLLLVGAVHFNGQGRNFWRLIGGKLSESQRNPSPMDEMNDLSGTSW